MMVTQHQARQRRCQITFASDEAGNCVGPKCMAWRWWNGNNEDNAEGYCGMAGPVHFMIEGNVSQDFRRE